MNSNSIFDSVASACADAIYALHGTAMKYTPSGGAMKNVKICIDEANSLNVTDPQTFDQPEISTSDSQFDRIVGSVRMSEVETLQEGDTFQSGTGPVFSVLPSSITNDGVEWSFEAVHRRTATNLFDLEGQRAVWGEEDDE